MTLDELLRWVLVNRWAGTPKEESQHADAKRFVLAVGPDRAVKSLKLADVVEYQTQLRSGGGRKASTVNRMMGPVRTMLRDGARLGQTPAGLEVPRLREEEHAPYILSRDEERELLTALEAIDYDAADLAQFLLYTGLRVGEALSLTWDDVGTRMARDVVRLRAGKTKARRARNVPLCAEARAVLWRHDGPLERRRQRRDPLEWQAEGGPDGGPFDCLTYRRFHDAWTEARRALGKSSVPGYTPHALRHTCATRLLKAGVDVHTVMVWLGHRKITTTMRYLHSSSEDLTNAALALSGGR
jgi:integrase